MTSRCHTRKLHSCELVTGPPSALSMQLRVSRGHAGRATAKKPTCSVIAYTHRQGAQAMSTTKPVAAPTYNPQALAFAASTVAGALLARAALLANATDLRNALSKLGQLERQAAIGAFHPKVRPGTYAGRENATLCA